jgi:hypothetical protein
MFTSAWLTTGLLMIVAGILLAAFLFIFIK